jgi:hypothetical protein
MLNKIGASSKKNLRANLQALPYVNVNPASKNELDMNLDADIGQAPTLFPIASLLSYWDSRTNKTTILYVQ